MRSRSAPKAPAPPPSPATPIALSASQRHALIACAVAVATAFTHATAAWCGFIDLDDPGYVSENKQVLAGLTADGVAWAFTTLSEYNWHPLTWLSLQLDASVWGPEPFGFHLTNVALHAITAGLLYAVLAGMTGSAGRSAAAALLFAVHPLRVESVAWVSERKDVLSGLFWVLTMAAYAWYAAAPSWADGGRDRRVRAGAGRETDARHPPLRACVARLLAASAAWVSYRPPPPHRGEVAAVRAGGGVLGGHLLRPVAWRGHPRPVAAFGHGSTVRGGGRVRGLPSKDRRGRWTWPPSTHTRPPHARGGSWSARRGLLAAVTAAAIRLRRPAPYLLVGWFWYLGTLVPVIGLVQVGDQAYADRYTYIPHIGLAVAAVWGVADLLSRARDGGRWGIGLAAVVVVASVLATREQVVHWTDKVSLWSHALAVTEDNGQAELYYGEALTAGGKYAEALSHLERAEQLRPGVYVTSYARAIVLSQLGRFDEAEQAALDALALAGKQEKELADCWCMLGDISRMRGNPGEAVARYQRSLGYNSEQPALRNNYATALAGLGRTDEAIRVLTPAIELAPNNAMVAGNLGELLIRQSRFAEAVPHLRRASEIDPKSAAYRGRLAVALFALGERGEAVQLAKEATRLNPQWAALSARQAWSMATHRDASRRDGPAALRLAELLCACDERPAPELLDVLAAGYAETGRYDEAAAVAEQAAGAADRTGKGQLAADIRTRAGLYRTRQPYRAPEN